MRIDGGGNGESRRPSCSDTGQSPASTQNDFPEEKTLQLKFLDEVPDTVWTSTALVSKENECLKLALYNSQGRIVESGPGSYAKVDVVVLEANDNDDGDNMTSEKFESRIIKTEEKEKPHFAKDVHIYLKKGVGSLNGVRFGHGKDWIKKFKCRLGAKMGQNLNGFTVQEAWTQPFEVRDKRFKYKEKHDPPKLDSEVWRLVKIAKNGAQHKCLKGKNIETLRDFLFWFHVNPEGLKQILLGVRGGDSMWKAIVAHAKKCTIDDDQMMYSYRSLNEPQTSVVYSVVGKVKGVTNESNFVPFVDLSVDKKDAARKLLMSVLELPAFEHRYDTFFHDEASLLFQFPPQNFGGAAPVDTGFKNHGLLLEEHQINAGASEDESSRRLSTMRSFEENSMQDFWTSINHMEIPYDVTSLQQYQTIQDDFVPFVDPHDFDPFVDPHNFCAVTPSDFELPVEDGTDDFGTCFISFTDHAEINAGMCGTSSSGVFVGIGDENEQCPIGFRTRSAKRWGVMLAVLKWQLSIMRNRTRVVLDTRKRKR